MRLYRSALSRARRQQGFVIRPITPADNPRIAAVVRAVSAEYGLTADKGYGVADPNLDFLHETYQGERSRYWVIEGPDGAILGGGGSAAGGGSGMCELQKMYFLPALRGLGLGRRLVLQALAEARALGYQRCYLETTAVLRKPPPSMNPWASNTCRAPWLHGPRRLRDLHGAGARREGGDE
jgi:putative acetyltransferase